LKIAIKKIFFLFSFRFELIDQKSRSNTFDCCQKNLLATEGTAKKSMFFLHSGSKTKADFLVNIFVWLRADKHIITSHLDMTNTRLMLNRTKTAILDTGRPSWQVSMNVATQFWLPKKNKIFRINKLATFLINEKHFGTDTYWWRR